MKHFLENESSFLDKRVCFPGPRYFCTPIWEVHLASLCDQTRKIQIHTYFTLEALWIQLGVQEMHVRKKKAVFCPAFLYLFVLSCFPPSQEQGIKSPVKSFHLPCALSSDGRASNFSKSLEAVGGSSPTPLSLPLSSQEVTVHLSAASPLQRCW